MEKAGKFPKRIQLGPNRVGWVEDEGLNWLQHRLEHRLVLSRFDAAPLIAFTATKEMSYEINPNGRIV